MKKTITIIVLISFLFSCSTSNKVVSNKLFQKRKYTKGWHKNTGENYALKKNSELHEKKIAKINSNQVIKKSELTINKPNTNSIDFTAKTDNINKEKEQFLIKESTTGHNLIASNSESVTVISNIIQQDKIESLSNVKKYYKKKKSFGTGKVILLFVLAFLIPFISAGIASNWKNGTWFYNILWCLLGFVPGIIHAIIVIIRESKN